MKLENKEKRLLDCLRKIGPAVIAFSGGVDSSLLLTAAKKAYPEESLAVMVKPPYVPDRDEKTSRDLATLLEVDFVVIDMNFPSVLRHNPEDRCYLCKKLIFQKIMDFAHDKNQSAVLEGSNADDLTVHRPGRRALEEMGIRSPLAECGFSKNEVRALSKKWELPVWNKPASPCLLTRFPHGREIRKEHLNRVDRVERFIISEGFSTLRVRDYGDLARIELPESDFSEFCKPDRLQRIREYLQKSGYRYITLDLEGYRSGSMDPENI